MALINSQSDCTHLFYTISIILFKFCAPSPNLWRAQLLLCYHMWLQNLHCGSSPLKTSCLEHNSNFYKLPQSAKPFEPCTAPTSTTKFSFSFWALLDDPRSTSCHLSQDFNQLFESSGVFMQQLRTNLPGHKFYNIKKATAVEVRTEISTLGGTCVNC